MIFIIAYFTDYSRVSVDKIITILIYQSFNGVWKYVRALPMQLRFKWAFFAGKSQPDCLYSLISIYKAKQCHTLLRNPLVLSPMNHTGKKRLSE